MSNPGMQGLFRTRLFQAVTLLLLSGWLAIGAPCQTPELVIEHVSVIEPGSDKPRPDVTVSIRDGVIQSVLAPRKAKIPKDAQIVDGRGKYLMPALWDMHVHFRDVDRDMRMYVANGVLGIRNMGSPADIYELRAEIAQGKRLGPKIVASGAIVDGPNSFSNPEFTVSVATPEEAREAVDAHKKQGADFIKVYDGLSRDAYFAILDEAKREGIPVAGHLPAVIRVREASDAGQRTLEHGMPLAGASTVEDECVKQAADRSVFLEAMRTRNFSIIPAKIARDNTNVLDHFDRARADDEYRTLTKNGTFLTPTLVTQRSLTFIDDLAKAPDPRMVYVSAEEANFWRPENGMLTKYRTPEYIAMRKRQYAKMMEEIPRARVAGVLFLAGTDVTAPYTYPGFSLHDELRLFVQAGLTPAEAIETATSNPARLLGLAKTWGQVAPGFMANLILLNENPLARIENTQKIEAVVSQGKLFDRRSLDRLLKEAEQKH